MTSSIPIGAISNITATLYGLRDTGLIDDGEVAEIEAALASGNSALILRYIDEFEGTEADAAYLGIDADVRDLRTALAASIGYSLPGPTNLVLAPGAPLTGERSDRQRTYDDTGVQAFVPTLQPVLTVESEYANPNFEFGIDDTLPVDRFNNPLGAAVIVGHTSMTSGNVAAGQEQIRQVLDLIGATVTPSVPVMRTDDGRVLHADGRELTEDEAKLVFGEWNADVRPDVYGFTPNDVFPPTIFYARGLDDPGNGNIFLPGDRDVIIPHESGHALYMLLPAESQERLHEQPGLRDMFLEINQTDAVSAHPDPVRAQEERNDEYIADAIRAYLTNPAWFKAYFPEIADAIAREVNAAPAFRGILQFN